jgi:hypothetical protein
LASFLKNSTLSLFNEIVTFTLSSLKTNKCGAGRKSLMILVLPMGSFVYSVLFFISPPAFSPVSGPDNADHALPIREPDGQDFVMDAADAIKSFFITAMGHILHDHAPWIKKSMLSQGERDTMLRLILHVFIFVPIKMSSCHDPSVA